MKYGLLFSLASILFLFQAVSSGRWFWLLLWPSLSFGLIAAAYLRGDHRIFGKRPDGSMSMASVVLLLPYLVYLWVVWHIIRLVSREDRCDLLGDRLTIGRRLLSNELPAETETVVDLTCEFPEPMALRSVPRYLCIPLLDAAAASPETLAAFARQLAEIDGPMFIHCAQGHGRTGLITALLLIARGSAADPDDALSQFTASRPRLALNRVQSSALVEAAVLLQATG
jgi:hypothetical protein